MQHDGSPGAKLASAYAAYGFRSAREVADDLEHLVDLLKTWQKVQNLVSRETLTDIWQRHVEDSLQLLPLLKADDRRLVDVGSGGGFPALPMAVVLRGGGRWTTLFEPTQRKATFLRTAIRELQLDADVRVERLESDSRETAADVITARAVTSLRALLEMTLPLFGARSRALFHKGREHGEEVTLASHAFSFDVIRHASATDAAAVILEISNPRALSKG